MDREDESVYLLDMTACEPGHAISEEFERSKWTCCSYRIDQGEGKMLFCGPDTKAPPLRLTLGVQGWYHILVGTYRSEQATPDWCLLIKLSADPGYTRAVAETFRPGKDFVPPEMVPGPADICEAYWKSADLTGQDIIFHRPVAGAIAESSTNISYIRLVPMSDSEKAEAKKDLARRDTRRLIANYDGGQHHKWAYATDQEMADEFQALANSDFKMVLWGCASSFATHYSSRVGSEMKWSFGLSGYNRHGLKVIDRYRRHGFNPLRSAVRAARDIGVEIYAEVRMLGEQLPPNHRGFLGPGEFQRQHPEWRCVTPEGNPARHLSQAFPEVRAKYVDLFREWVEDCGVDGVCIIFCRSFPYVLYEKPVLDSFMGKHGLNMKDLDRFDERVLNHRAEFLTQLLRDTRDMLDEVGKEKGRRLGTCYVIPGDTFAPEGCPDLGPFTTPRSRAMDVETWVREDLVDHLIVHLENKGDPDGRDSIPRLRPYIDLAQGTGTQVYADLYPRRQAAEFRRIRAMSCYEAGVDGLCIWDSHWMANRLSGWAMTRLLGHEEELPRMKAFAESMYRCVPMSWLDGFFVRGDFGLPTDG